MCRWMFARIQNMDTLRSDGKKHSRFSFCQKTLWNIFFQWHALTTETLIFLLSRFETRNDSFFVFALLRVSKLTFNYFDRMYIYLFLLFCFSSLHRFLSTYFFYQLICSKSLFAHFCPSFHLLSHPLWRLGVVPSLSFPRCVPPCWALLTCCIFPVVCPLLCALLVALGFSGSEVLSTPSLEDPLIWITGSRTSTPTPNLILSSAEGGRANDLTPVIYFHKENGGITTWKMVIAKWKGEVSKTSENNHHSKKKHSKTFR